MTIDRIVACAGSICLFFAAGLQAQTANDCIAEYENLKAEFELADPGAEMNCVVKGNLVSLDTEGALPAGCTGNWDHWHLEARAGVGKDERSCVVMLRGLEGQEGCGTAAISYELAANEAAKWRNYLRKECGK